ncbi:MAG: transmembrane domain-containing protein, partial [Candidatus Eisenbacteria bacterium]|nr:transmembrane domain-containing protein [Candidatus Eisenbacteria bacterium]
MKRQPDEIGTEAAGHGHDPARDPERTAPSSEDPEMTAPHARTDDPNAPMTAAVGVVGAVLIFLIIVGLQALFYRWNESETRRKTWGVAPEELARATADQKEQIRSYRWVDAQKGIVTIPIDRAMELEARDLNRPAEPATVSYTHLTL